MNGASGSAAGASKPMLIQPGEVSGPPAPEVKLTREQCNTIRTDAPVINGCQTATIRCGETIVGHTRGGVEKFDTEFYERGFCTPATTNHDGGDERIYILDVTEPQTRAIVYLDTPCANLDLAAFKAQNVGTCPDGERSSVDQCEMNVKGGNTREKVDLWANHPTRWWVVVEGQGEEEGAFSLTVQCEKW